MKLKNYDYYLIILTTLVLFAIGLVCIYGITYYNYLSANPAWTRTPQYVQYIEDMNLYLYPFLILLLIALGLCIPKRLFEQDILVKLSAAMLTATLILMFLSGMETGMGFILAVTSGLQGIVLIMTIKKSRAIRFEREGYVVRLGSSLLHLGVVILVLNFVSLRENPLHISIFWSGTVLVIAGNVFSFYSGRIASFIHYE
ncbi:MAG: hypothetical protein OIN66_04490 [Candidatus Methanoperedens sp.]|nr:hypothetical protein [Candidatus Methanoperedens sp.]